MMTGIGEKRVAIKGIVRESSGYDDREYTEDVEPCPFCKTKNFKSIWHHWYGGNSRHVMCHYCYAQGPTSDGDDDAVRDMWNSWVTEIGCSEKADNR